jgi:hypothetical protein
MPEAVVPIAELMSSFAAPWAVCGGWAIDAWLGRALREHGDVDLCVFNQDRLAIRDHLSGWQLVAHDTSVAGDASDLWDGRALELPGHLHARRDVGEPLPDSVNMAAEQGFSLDIQLNNRNDDHWVLLEQPKITVPLKDAIQPSPWGMPTVVPEVLLFFKAQDLRRRDRLDFQAVLPNLSVKQRTWLRDAIARMGHPWLSELA